MVAITTVVFPACTGIAAHLSLFIRGEWHLQAPKIVVAHLLALVPLNIFLSEEDKSRSLVTQLPRLTLWCFSYLFGLFGSIIVYRLFFHRLRKFPGPPLAAATKLWHVWKCVDSRNYLVLEKAHRKYGDFVRTGPREITIFTPAAFLAMDGPTNQNGRADWYDIAHPRYSPIFSREREDHHERRRIWHQAISIKTIKDYLPRILRQIKVLDEKISETKSQPFLINDLMLRFTFDSMGEFAFNESFGMMESGKWHWAVAQQRSALVLLGPFTPAVWAARLAFAFTPWAYRVRDWFGMMKFCEGQMEKRLKMQPKEPDIASYFIEEYHKNAGKKSEEYRHQLLNGNAVTVIVGGSDTTHTTLIHLWYWMCHFPEHAEKIHEEVKGIDISDLNALGNLDHLNAVINETMRITPTTPSFGLRTTPKEGLMVEGTWIPPDINIIAPRYSIFRSERSFEEPLSFIPERWYSRPELVKDRQAFAPFGLGRSACLGKPLALTQMRLVVAKLMRDYRIKFAPGEDGSRVERDMRDQMTALPGHLDVVFEPR